MKAGHKMEVAKDHEQDERRAAWDKVLDDLSSKAGLDLSFLDDLGDEPVRDEALKLPYEYADS